MVMAGLVKAKGSIKIAGSYLREERATLPPVLELEKLLDPE